MEGRFKKLLIFGTFLVIMGVIPKTGSLYYIQEYILITDPKLSWTEAQSYCRAQYNDLATISNDHDFSVITAMTWNWTSAFWIGLHVNSWRWSLVGKHFYTGVEEDYRQWQDNQPDNAAPQENCASMMDDGFWRDNRCMLKMPLICFRENDEAIHANISEGSGSTFQNGKDGQYVLATDDKSWYEARNYCREHYTNLVAVRSSAENQALKNLLQKNHSVQEAWIGLHRGSWKWSDGSTSLFRMWGHQPENENNSQSCVAMENGGWSNRTCSTGFGFLCQKITELSEGTSAPVSQPANVSQVRRRTSLKMKFSTDSNLTDPKIQHQLIEQIEAVFHLQGFLDIKLLRWSVRAEPKSTERDECGEEKKKNGG